jgi:hypothetical protein
MEMMAKAEAFPIEDSMNNYLIALASWVGAGTAG